MKFSFVQDITSNIKIFRDDLYPFLGGGNKARKMDSIARAIFSQKANALVATGGIHSNHCRTVAIFAAKHKMKCTLVLSGNKSAFYEQSGNAKIMRLSGATIVFVNDPQEIGPQMDFAMSQYQKEGFSPYYIWGGGHTLEGGKAYIDAIEELKDYCDENDWQPDYIFHASGTGSTQSGILAGLDKFGFKNTKVVGISVARPSERAARIVNESYRKLCVHYRIECTEREVIVLDDYLCGGYEKYNDELKRISDNSIREYGFTLDTCYTGKAFYGMQHYIKHNNIGSNILFWHTGGVFNFLI